MKTALITAAFNVKNEIFNSKYNICLRTWELWCEKNNVDFIPLVGEKNDIVDIVFSKWIDLDKFIDLDQYDYITMVDFDTIVRWDCPNFMEQFYNEKIIATLVPDQGGKNVMTWHYNQWLGFDPDLYSYSFNYFNSGFISAQPQVFKLLSKEMSKYKDYYLSHKDKSFHPVGIGIDNGIRLDALDQTPVNLVLHKHYRNQIVISPNILNYMVAHHTFDLDNDISYIEEALIIHYGSTNVCKTKVIDTFWNNFKENYK